MRVFSRDCSLSQILFETWIHSLQNSSLNLLWKITIQNTWYLFKITPSNVQNFLFLWTSPSLGLGRKIPPFLCFFLLLSPNQYLPQKTSLVPFQKKKPFLSFFNPKADTHSERCWCFAKNLWSFIWCTRILPFTSPPHSFPKRRQPKFPKTLLNILLEMCWKIFP